MAQEKIKMIWLVGDSHTNLFRDIPNKRWKSIHLGAPTAYHLENYDEFWKFVQFTMEPEDTVIPVVGEIDCRTHICYQAKLQGHSFSVGVMDTILHFDHVLSRLRDMNISFAVWNVIPAGHWTQDLVFKKKYHIAPIADRIAIHTMYHEMLALWCQEHLYSIVDIWDKIIGPDGHTKRELKPDEVHLSAKCLPFYIEEFKKLGLWPESD